MSSLTSYYWHLLLPLYIRLELKPYRHLTSSVPSTVWNDWPVSEGYAGEEYCRDTKLQVRAWSGWGQSSTKHMQNPEKSRLKAFCFVILLGPFASCPFQCVAVDKCNYLFHRPTGSRISLCLEGRVIWTPTRRSSSLLDSGTLFPL